METNLKENQKYMSKIGMRFFLGTLLIIVVQYAFYYLFEFAAPDFNAKYSFLTMMLPMYIIAIPVIVFSFKSLPVETEREKKKLSILQFIGFFVVSFAAMYVFNLLGNALASIIGLIKGGNVQNSIVDIATTNNLWMNFLVMVICAPIAEELLFRKLLIDRTRKFGDKFAIILSGLMFGFFHGNIYQFCYAFALGMVFAYVYCRTSNIKYTIALHMLINFMGSILGVLVLKLAGIDELLSGAADQAALTAALMKNIPGLLIYLAYLAFIFIVVIVGIVIFFVKLKKLEFTPAAVVVNKGERFKTVALNVGMGLFFLFWICFTIFQTLV